MFPCLRGGRSTLLRKQSDYYFKVEPNSREFRGNLWFMSTLWLAQWLIAIAKDSSDLIPVREIIDCGI
jgi:GH15 family glucan-1,4-alpha-glucosidase